MSQAAGGGPPPQFDCFGLTEMGPEDDVNDDCFAVEPALGLFLVADGMGGRPAGARASSITTETFLEQLKRLDAPARVEEAQLRRILAQAHENVRGAAAADPSLSGLGTTLSAVVFHGAGGKMVHVGDSRIYRLRGGQLSQLSRDHTLAAEIAEREKVAPEDSQLPFRHMLSRYVGSDTPLEPDVAAVELEPGDWLVLTTDGVSKAMKRAQMEKLLAARKAPTAESLCRDIMDATREVRPEDDVTAVVLGLAGN